MIDVVAAIIQNENEEILIAKRKTGKQMAGFWEFPGGKVEKGEKPEDSLKRELKEEMDILIEVNECLGENVYDYGSFSIRLIAYWAKIVKGDIILHDHDEFKWSARANLEKYKFAPADIYFVQKLIKS